MALNSGTRLGPYEILASIGAGGMGEVYKARDTRLERLVAIKVLPEHLAKDPERGLRFEREAKAISQLNHPHICTLHDIHFRDAEHEEDLDYMVFELIEGETLRARLGRRRLSIEEARDIAIAIAEALAEAHRKDIIHRDLKPANVMFARRGTVKVMDFGLASPVPRVGAANSEAPTAAARITQAGAIVGTPAYMSPEQILGGTVDERSDLFSFGIVLHEMLTGLHPFAGPSPVEMMAAILKEPPSIAPSLVSPFTELVTRLLAAKPEERMGSFEDVLKMLVSPNSRVSGAHAPTQQAGRIRKERERLVGERRTVTVLVGSITSSNDERDEEEVFALLQGTVTSMEGIIGRYEGTLAERRDDGVLAVFGAPIAQEDAARRAVAVAMEMASRFEGFRAGLHTGPIVVDRVEEDLQVSFTPLGDTLRGASRLEARADGGEVLVSERAYLGARNFFELEPIAAADGTHNAYKVLRERTGGHELELDAALTPFVGRAHELSTLEAFYRRTRECEGQIVLLSGQAGIGKSRLLLEFRRSLSDMDIGWLSGSCAALSAGTPYSAVIELLKSAFSIDESDSEADILRRIEEETARWQDSAREQLPFLKYLLNVNPSRPEMASMDPIELRLGIHNGLAALLEELCHQRPLVMVIEDLHWIDGASQDAVVANADLVASLPALVLLTYRPGYEQPIGERSFVHRVSLPQLDAEDGQTLVRGMLETGELPRELEQLVSEKSGGNPFFAEEITRSLLESGMLNRKEGAYILERPIEEIQVPDQVQDVILARIDRLPAEARRALQLASVIGREFAYQLLQRISESHIGLDDALAELKTLELLREKSRFPELYYMFKHALVHDVAYGTLLRQRRRELHATVADAIEALYSERLADHYEALAHHCSESGDSARALVFFEHAAEKAARSFSNDEALDFYARAIEAGEKIGEGAVGKVIDIMRRQAELLVNLSRFGEAFGAIARLKEKASSVDDRHGEAMAMALEGWARGFNHEIDKMVAASKSALDMAEDDDHEVRFLASLTPSFFLYAYHRVEEARPYLDMAERLAPLARDRFRQAWWGIVGWHQLNWEGRYDEVLEHLGQWQSTAEKGTSRWVRVGLDWQEAITLGGKGDYSRALTLSKEVLETSEHIGAVFWVIRTVNVFGWLYAELQDHALALEWNRRGIQVAIEAGEVFPEVECNARLNVGDNLMALGRLDEAEEEFRFVEALVRDPRPEQRMDMWRYAQHMFHSYGELILLRGDPDRATQYADECLAIAEPGNHRKNIVKGRRLRGEVFLATENLENAETELTCALEIAEAVGNPPQLWKTWAALGELRKRQDRLDDSKACYREALRVIERVAENLDKDELRNIFLDSDHVRAIRTHSKAFSM